MPGGSPEQDSPTNWHLPIYGLPTGYQESRVKEIRLYLQMTCNPPKRGRPTALHHSGRGNTAMLRITIEDEIGASRVILSGKLTGAWVIELSKAWRGLQHSAPNKPVAVDLREVVFVDQAGQQLLAEMSRSGAAFTTRGVMMNSLVKEITFHRPGVHHAAAIALLLLAFA